MFWLRYLKKDQIIDIDREVKARTQPQQSMYRIQNSGCIIWLKEPRIKEVKNWVL